MTTATHLAIRLVLTALLVAWVVLPYRDGSPNESVLGELFRIGVVPSVVVLGSFFVMVAFYCRTLERCLTLIRPEHRTVAARSVWWMFAIPFNFVEDFFIVINLANSLENERRATGKLDSIGDLGMVSGIGWALAQVLSFIPNMVGQTAGLLGMILVVLHWTQIARINRLLSDGL